MNSDLWRWLENVPAAVPRFLANMQGRRIPGYYRYSFTGDLFGEETHWGLGNTVFAVKCWYMLRHLANLPPTQHQAMISFISSFRAPSGYIFDPLVQRRARLTEIITAVRTLRLANVWHEQVRTAETRQSLAALRLLGISLDPPPASLLTTSEHIDRFIAQLNWRLPWGAASHVSHLVAHLAASRVPNRDDLIEFTVRSLTNVQLSTDGAWYRGSPTRQQKVNGAMKVITALSAAGESFAYADRLIDLTLSVPDAPDACSRLNSLYILRHASALVPGYRTADIHRFTEARLNRYRQYYYPKLGGFSFLPRQANTTYYGARISAGRDEPDIHGTTLFLWGASLAVNLLGLENKISLQELPP